MASPTIREGRQSDVTWVMDLVSTTNYLQCHTEHTYWILLTYGRRYFMIAENADQTPIGFISGLRSTVDPSCIFVWQLVVAQAHRRSRAAYDLLVALTDRAKSDGCNYINAAIDPTNLPLSTLIDRWAEDTGRVWGPVERISYDAPTPAGAIKTVIEDIILVTQADDEAPWVGREAARRPPLRSPATNGV